MDTYTLVRTEHLNHYGFLFGGQLLKWVDEYAWLAAAKDYSGYNLVTRGMAQIEFKYSVKNGSILQFTINKIKQGISSVTYSVQVFADEPGCLEEAKEVFSTTVTFACVDDRGKKKPLPQK